MNPDDRSTPEEDPIGGEDPSTEGDVGLDDDATQPRAPGHSGGSGTRGGSDDVTAESGPEADAEPVDAPLKTRADERGVLHRFRHDMEGPFMWVREVLSSVTIVLLIGLLLFAVSGAWPPMVAVKSESMEPNMEVGDLVFVTDTGRFAPDAANNDVGVVTHEVGREVDYRTFNDYGSVMIYQPPERQSSPIIHRAMFHVEEGENWYDRADERFHNANSCRDLRHCPAPRGGFITLGDNNREYDQASGIAEPVPAEWVTGVARARVPYLGYVRLISTGQAELSDVLAATGPGRGLLPSPSWTAGFVGSSWAASSVPAIQRNQTSGSMSTSASMSTLAPIPASTSPSQLSNRA